ncbi:hypothetical protein FY528_15565 [Hymenobacter lutimineralis]|uniref:Uncharacterized protein n=1 Tax=Hymenobacter lutimineralis TaxID=2606448 RepID=A0A5D6UUP5_9BACT|nr:hypothetical protein [Hymenobacter lutimineralis]TYZ07233.1 hypothetical protein FY528_15565 [Hymenobacter lutimineralis]
MATSLLVVFLNVFFGQVFCALAMPAAAAYAAEHRHPAGTPAHEHPRPAAHEHQAPHSHGAGHDAAAAHHHDEHKAPASGGSHQHGPKGACCQDDAAAVWASLTHPPKAGIEKMTFMPVALPPAPLALVVRFQQWDRTQPVLLVARRQLKPKIPDIRIFIQSLTV